MIIYLNWIAPPLPPLLVGALAAGTMAVGIVDVCQRGVLSVHICHLWVLAQIFLLRVSKLWVHTDVDHLI